MSKKGKRKMAEENGDDMPNPEFDKDPALYPADRKQEATDETRSEEHVEAERTSTDQDKADEVEPSLPPPPYVPPEDETARNASKAPNAETPAYLRLPEVLDDRAERNLVVKALAKTALIYNRKIGWVNHDGRSVLVIPTDLGPIGFHFDDEERKNFPDLPNLHGYEFDGADDRTRAERINRLVLK